jgi:hypothetical protein
MEDRAEHLAVCRNCRRTIPGKPYYMGGHAPYEEVGRGKYRQWRKNHYGGWVCSRSCDFRAALELEQSMPGHGSGQTSPGCYRPGFLDQKWSEE